MASRRHNNEPREGIRNVFPKDTAEWLNWITQGKLLYADKRKVQDLIDQQRMTFADVAYLDLNRVNGILNSFVNPQAENLQSAGVDFDTSELDANQRYLAWAKKWKFDSSSESVREEWKQKNGVEVDFDTPDLSEENENPAVNGALDHHNENAPRAGSAPSQPKVVLNRKAKVSQGTAEIVPQPAAEVKRRIPTFQGGKKADEASGGVEPGSTEETGNSREGLGEGAVLAEQEEVEATTALELILGKSPTRARPRPLGVYEGGALTPLHSTSLL